MIIQNLKVAFRNLLKYKVQTLLSIASIAIGIVTLALTFTIMTKFRLPSILDQPYRDRAYEITFRLQESRETTKITEEIIRCVKRDGGPISSELIAVRNGFLLELPVEFHLPDSTLRKGRIKGNFVDPEYVRHIGLRSAITDKKVKIPKTGEAIISERLAESIFNKTNPIGAVQTNTGNVQPIPVTIIDVFREPSEHDFFYENSLCFCVTENFEDNNLANFYASVLDVILKENYTPQQLLNEINQRVSQLGIEAELRKTLDGFNFNIIYGINILVYLVGSLILLAALIGFIRLQIQLFWLRRREISLRIVNGACRMQLFVLLLAEVIIPILLSIILAFTLGYLLQDFYNTNSFFRNTEIQIKNLGYFSSVIGGILIIISGIIVWLTLRLLCKSSLAMNMRRSRNHIFRNIMLGTQITISIIFVCSTFILINGGKILLEEYYVPKNDSFYNQCLYLQTEYSSQPERLLNEIDQLPDLDKIIMSGNRTFLYVSEVGDNPEIAEKFGGTKFFNSYLTNDTAMISFFGMEVEWFNNNVDPSQCILVYEDLYNRFRELGIIDNNTLTIISQRFRTSLPIAGIINKIPYNNKKDQLVTIFPGTKDITNGYVLVPKSGREKAFARSVNETIGLLEPENINTMVYSFRDVINPFPSMISLVTTGGKILGIVSLIITAMSIFSSIALDTRSRRKEVAIRKINGAKSIDIYRLFGRVYIVLLVLAVIVAIPVCVMFNGFVETYVKDHSTVEGFSPLWPVVLGILIVAALILTIVGWQTHKMLRIDPAKIIAKE